MGFRVKVLPGVRVGVSSRGVRTSVGPRIASVHVGGGRTGFSTGMGPVSYGTSIGGGSRSSGGYTRSSSGGSGGTYTSTYGPTPTQSAKIDEARQIEARITKLTKAHLEKFTEATCEKAYSPLVEPLAAITKRVRKVERAGIPFFKLAEHRAAKFRAAEIADAEHQNLLAAAEAERQEQQKELDAQWAMLANNDPATVMSHMTAAFGDNEAKSAVLNVDGDEATVLIVVPEMTVIPERDWSITSSGNLSVKKMTAASRNSYYFDMVFSQILATANEGFAVAPGIQHLKIVLVRNKAAKQLNRLELECMGFGIVSRSRLVLNTNESTFGLVQGASDWWSCDVDHNLKLKAVNLDGEPEIRELLKDITKI